MDKDIITKQGRRVFALSGGGGAGKDSIVNAILAGFPKRIRKVLRVTSRPLRTGEADGVNYYFTTKEDFEKREKEGEFVSTEEYVGNRYGISWKVLENAVREDDRLVVMVGGEPSIGLKKAIPEATIIYVKVPKEELLNRMMKRGDVTKEEARAKVADVVKQEDWEAPQFDHVVWNKDGRLEDAVKEVMRIMGLVKES